MLFVLCCNSDCLCLAGRTALMLHGFEDNAVPISVVICTKMHHTRLVYEKDGEYQNPCVGLCVDGTTSVSASGAALESISTPRYNEFYLNSHLAVLGTSKPCKYSLVYDEIGFKVCVSHAQ